MIRLLFGLFLAALRANENTGFGASPLELEAFAEVQGRRFIKARDLAEKILQKEPASFVALFVLGNVEHYAEGNLSRALRLLEGARRAYESGYSGPLGLGPSWRWHAEILRELAWISGEMDRRKEELSYLDAHDRLYAPSLIAERAWPLMKLGRIEDARVAIERALASGERDQVDRALTAKCALEYETEQREAALEACTRAAEAERRDPHPGSIPFGNAAEAALSVLRFDLAESLLREGAQKPSQGGDNPFTQLAMLYLTEGRFAEAKDSLLAAVALRRRRPPYLDQQMRAEIDSAAATFLIAAGAEHAAMRLTRRASLQPDRAGLKSGLAEIALAGAAIAHGSATRLAVERLRERASTAPFWERARLEVEASVLRIEAFRAGRRAATLLSDRGRLLATLRPYLGGGALVATFLVPDIVAWLGPGVVESALAEARRRETLTAAKAYLDELAAEAALGRNHFKEALHFAEAALAGLPASEKLLEARVAAIAGQAAVKLGERRASLVHFDRALQRDPGAVRRLGLRIPVRISSDTSSRVAQTAAHLLRRSPRLDVEREGFEVRIAADRACLIGLHGAVLGCGELASPGQKDARQLARQLCDSFHERVFAARVDLAQSDLSTLDGSTATAGSAASEQSRSLLRELR